MSRDARSLTTTLVLFYGIGTVLALGAYALDRVDDFAVILTLWSKQTLTSVVLGAGYYLYCVIASSTGHRPKAPLRSLNISFLTALATLGILMVI
ncbi:hypothetical protein [Bradyrhizobium sp. C9]|uniref:hypothetical protein n=1 Tax=Bradyrhizobium sp. C9 TaxID=142585 RepID=UPI000BE9B64D|nr:hypothetical protein [Bradyrhizobium sp. C9]PDT77795.1 hypothetical protein CO675_09485 [Bradyrhizobium sp. C9]